MFKLVSCKPGASRELALSEAPYIGLRSSKCSKLVFGYVNVIVVMLTYRDNFILLIFE